MTALSLLTLLLLPSLASAAPPVGMFHQATAHGIMGWDAYEYCAIKENDPNDAGSRQRRDSVGLYYLQRDADARCEGADGSAKLVEETFQVTGLCSASGQGPAVYSILAVARFKCSKPLVK